MIQSPLVWLSALWIGVLIHVDWHLGRPGYDHLGFDLSYHWLLGIATFAPLPWLVVRRWPNSARGASLLVIALGVLVGQGIEPLGEVILFKSGAEPFTNPVRWRVFAEFMAAGIVTYLTSAALAFKRARTAA